MRTLKCYCCGLIYYTLAHWIFNYAPEIRFIPMFALLFLWSKCGPKILRVNSIINGLLFCCFWCDHKIERKHIIQLSFFQRDGRGGRGESTHTQRQEARQIWSFGSVFNHQALCEGIVGNSSAESYYRLAYARTLLFLVHHEKSPKYSLALVVSVTHFSHWKLTVAEMQCNIETRARDFGAKTFFSLRSPRNIKHNQLQQIIPLPRTSQQF